MEQSLFVASRIKNNDGIQWIVIGRLDYDHCQGYRFLYTRGATNHNFRPLPGMPDLDAIYESQELFPLFANRLLAPSRSEYEAFLRWGGVRLD